jgi:predicted enzyme related to lactoylglutathione lyase
MPRVTRFEIYADDPYRAIKFYENVFGWIVKSYEGPMEYWTITTGDNQPGIDGFLMRRQQPRTGTQESVSYVCMVSVDSIIAFTDKIEAHGGKVVTPKTTIPGIGWFVQCQDTEGNIFALVHENPSVGTC